MRPFIHIVVGLMLLAGLSGCFKTKEIFALNPDGSGKVFYQLTHAQMDTGMSFNMGNSEAKKDSPEDLAKKEAEKILKESSGIDAWKDVSWEVNELGEFTFKGTAYFPDINELKMGGNVKSSNHSVFKKTDQGISLVWSSSKKDSPQEDEPSQAMDEASIDLAVKKAKAEMAQAMGMLSGILPGMKEEVFFMLPGKIDTVNNFTKVKENLVKIVFDGKKLLRLMKTFSQDDAAIRQVVSQGGNAAKEGPPEDYMNKMLFGNEGNVEVTVSGDLSPVFDYATESMAAIEAYPGMCETLGIEMPKKLVPLPPVEGAVSGTIHGTPFALKEAYIQGDILHLRQGEEFFVDQGLVIFLFLKEDETLSGKTYQIDSSSRFGSPHIHMKYKVPEKKFPETEMFTDEYLMTLTFGEIDGSSISGEISLVLPDDMDSKVAGRFVAEIK